MTKKNLFKALENMSDDQEISLLITDINGYTVPYVDLQLVFVDSEWVKLIET